MQWPPTNPGLKLRKFHFVAAAAKTSLVSIPINLNIFANSLTNAIFKSRWEFSITFAASATFILLARWVPFSRIELYNLSTISATSGVEPEVIFSIFVRVCSLSPGFMRSGLYPQKKSLLYFIPLNFSNTGTHSSSVHPG